MSITRLRRIGVLESWRRGEQDSFRSPHLGLFPIRRRFRFRRDPPSRRSPNLIHPSLLRLMSRPRQGRRCQDRTSPFLHCRNPNRNRPHPDRQRNPSSIAPRASPTSPTRAHDRWPLSCLSRCGQRRQISNEARCRGSAEDDPDAGLRPFANGYACSARTCIRARPRASSQSISPTLLHKTRVCSPAFRLHKGIIIP